MYRYMLSTFSNKLVVTLPLLHEIVNSYRIGSGGEGICDPMEYLLFF